MKHLLQLSECGQSYWLDNLSRAMIKDGTLKKRVTAEGLRGVTSNPTIFNRAISKSSDYDSQIRDLVGEGGAIEKIYERLVVTDVQEACDLLDPVFEATDGVDGFVSLEVSPHLAHDAEGTMEEAPPVSDGESPQPLYQDSWNPRRGFCRGEDALRRR